ncbi:unnamed protein product [Anisakis simplex]|uniref:Carnitine O-palmitoyltransferase 2, mitochondrial (inferred by orthology to a human protein) n=1 Tax=Anisakis simplex TaxID=6269 RepID=A0A0M3KFM1_ANISI|nr:unnamed protein product [Anisakis simplex]
MLLVARKLSLWALKCLGMGRFWKHTLSGDAYQFLHKSEIPSYHFQKSLRRLPIPKLEKSCERLLASASAVLHEIPYMLLHSAVKDFRKFDGPGKLLP